jgi:3-hydroxybutyryl-CoA dehydrogenase
VKTTPSRAAAAIAGGGKMGGDIAALLAARGWRVEVYEPAAAMRASFPRRVAAALATLRAPRAASRVRLHERLEALRWADVALVIEAAPEKLALKQRLLREIEALAPRTAVLTTNSSSLRLAEVAALIERPQRVAGMHWLSPAHLAPVVEVVRGERTAAAVVRRINAWLAALGKIAVNLQRDVPGMIVNRVQHAMLREAFALIDRGIASPEDIDAAVRFGFGFRYVACGPIRQRDFNGLAIHREAAAQIYPTLHRGARPARCLERLVRAGHVGVTAGRGFYRWDRARLARELRRYEERLGAALRLMEADRRRLVRRG